MTTILTIYAVIALAVLLWLLEAAIRLRDGWGPFFLAVVFAAGWLPVAVVVLARGRLR